MAKVVKKSNRKHKSNLPEKYLREGGPGRKKGSKNKFTTLRDSFLEAFEKTGGTKGLVEWIEKHPSHRGEFYKMITRMLPTNVDVTTSGNLTVVVSSQFKPKKVVPTNNFKVESNDP